MEEHDDVLAEINDLYVNFYTYQGIVKAIDGIDLTIRKGETLGLVGETGCGKSVTASTIMKLVLSPPGKIESGSVYFMETPEVRAKRKEYEQRAQKWYDGLSLKERKKVVARYGLRFTGFKKRVRPPTQAEVDDTVPPERVPDGVMKEYLKRFEKGAKGDAALQDALGRKYDLLQKRIEYMQLIRGRFISMIFQEPTAALNPVFTAGDQIAEVILQHRKSEMAKRALSKPKSGPGFYVLEAVKNGPRPLEAVYAELLKDHDVKRDETAEVVDELKRRNFIKLTKEKILAGPASKAGADKPLTEAEESVMKAVNAGPVALEKLYEDLSKSHGVKGKYADSVLKGLKKRGLVIVADGKATQAAPKDKPKDTLKMPLTAAESAIMKTVKDGPVIAEKMYGELRKGHGVKREDANKAITALQKRGLVTLSTGGVMAVEKTQPRTYRVRMLELIAKNPNAIGTMIEKIPLVRRVPYVNQHSADLYGEAIKEAARMLEIVRIPDPRAVVSRYPFELSGGMQQRVMIAIALACNPKLLIADEPTTALDVTIQAQILKLMRDLKGEYGSSILLITHNLGVVAEMCDRVGVMYAGSMAEIGPVRTIFKEPLHPYTNGLMKSVPSAQQDAETLFTIRGSVPNLVKPPGGCRFHPRCDYAKDLCKNTKPKLVEVSPDHFVACHKITGAEGYE